MNGLGSKVYYKLDGDVDWLKSIVKTVYAHTDYDADCVCIDSAAADRALRLYYKKTDIMEADVNTATKGEMQDATDLIEDMTDLIEDMRGLIGELEEDECPLEDVIRALTALSSSVELYNMEVAGG